MEVTCINILNIIFQVSILTSILAIIILILRPMIRKILGINIVYFLWLLLIIKLIIPYGPESKISIYNLFNKVDTSISYDEKLINDNSQIKSYTNKIKTPINNTSETSNNIIEKPMSKSANINNYFNTKTILISIWITGISIFFIFLIFSYYKLINIRKNMIYRYNRQSYKILKDCLTLLNIRRNIEILVVNEISSPALCGVIKPKILIPIKIFNNIKKEELKYIILHELCHYKRKDVTLTLLIYLLKAVYWFNPIILFALNTLKEDCEVACDNMVISKLDKRERVSYGYTIINVLSYIGEASIPLGISSMINNKKKLKERIIMIGNNKKIGIGKIITGIGIIILLGSITLSSGMNSEKSELKDTNSINKKLVNNISNEINTKVVKGKDVTLDVDLNEVSLTNKEVNSKINAVIYNSHGDEEYKDGYSVMDAGRVLNDKLNELSINSTFLECQQPSEYKTSFLNAENTIKENIANFSSYVLIDIHRGESNEEDTDKSDVEIILAEKCENYSENLSLANTLNEELVNRGIKTKIVQYKEGINNFNLHLSKKSIVLNVGDETMSVEEINKILDSISESFSTILQ